ncbi:MAG: hypothetical protein JNM46_09915 [Anaerolineales bacterium]|nr:hypothetical protein [Anaerolineales bacterium]
MMKKFTSILFAIILGFIFVIPVGAQTPEAIWITADTSSFKTGETVIVTVYANSATPIQGFTFQIRYDPACLEPVNAASPISGMNGLLLPQLGGLVDASFASTTPLTANGVLAEVRFNALSACETNLTLESAALAIKNESGIAAPLPGISIPETQKAIPLTISSEKGSPSNRPLIGSPLSLEVESDTPSQLPTGTIVVLAIIVVLLVIGIFILIRILKSNDKN